VDASTQAMATVKSGTAARQRERKGAIRPLSLTLMTDPATPAVSVSAKARLGRCRSR
jgi:hypothetical protein